MPIFVDRHDLAGLTAADIAEAHRRDLEVQGEYGVRFLTYWFDDARKTGFCLIDAPDAETAMRVHAEAHGALATDVIQVDLSAVEAFLGRIADPPAPAGAPIAEPAFRAVMFTDIVGSTEMTAKLGDARGVEMVRAHDSLVRRALSDHGGREVKHLGDGIMASFDAPVAAVDCARSIQRALNAFNAASDEPLRVRIGIDAGEPLQESNDLFGATVQRAARLCQTALPEAICVSEAVRNAIPATIATLDGGSRELKGFPEPVTVYEVVWR
jgi:class 3 adenylate cyclase